MTPARSHRPVLAVAIHTAGRPPTCERSHPVPVGHRGRLVLPAELCARADLAAGTPLVLMGTADGVVPLTKDQLKARIGADLDGVDLVGELLATRRTAAAEEAEC